MKKNVKKVLLGILLSIGLFIIIVMILFAWACYNETCPHDYRIDDICMEQILLEDSLTTGNDYYRISINYTPVHVERGFWVGGVQPYLNGNVDSIVSLVVFTNTGEKLNDLPYKVLDLDDNLLQCHSLDDIKTSLQGKYPYATYYISVNKEVSQPVRISLKFQDREIDAEITHHNPPKYTISYSKTISLSRY